MCIISSDLWVSETISNAQDTGVTSGVTYDIGTVTGKWFCVLLSGIFASTVCGIIREYQNSTVGVSRIYDSQPGIP